MANRDAIDRDRLVDEFLDLARVSSPSKREGAIAKRLRGTLERMGATVEVDDAGIVAIFEAVRVLRETNTPHGPIDVLLTICEEMGLVGAKHFDVGRLRARRGLVLDCDGVSELITRAPAANRMQFTVHGLEAHAGIAPEQGLSAIKVAGEAIAAMRLGRVDAETTANVGRIEGGLASNIIPNRVHLRAEARSLSEAGLEAQTRHMAECFERAAARHRVTVEGREHAARFEARVDRDYDALSVADSAPIVRLMVRASERLGAPFRTRATGGGSDANVFAGRGVEVANLACGMREIHTVHEWVDVKGMREWVLSRSRVRMFAFLNISAIGLMYLKIGELNHLAYADVDSAVGVGRDHADLIVGIKVRNQLEVVGDAGVEPLRRAVRAAAAIGGRVMIHCTNPPVPMAELLALLRPGDIVSHFLHGRGHGILDDKGQIRKEVRAARERGVVFDVAHGRMHVKFPIARAAMEQKFYPDTISSDLTSGGAAGCVKDLPTTMGKFLNLGMPLPEVVRAVTAAPARAIGRAGKLGTLRAGTVADVAVFRLEDGRFDFEDAHGEHMTGVRRFAPTLTLRAGEIW